MERMSVPEAHGFQPVLTEYSPRSCVRKCGASGFSESFRPESSCCDQEEPADANQHLDPLNTLHASEAQHHEQIQRAFASASCHSAAPASSELCPPLAGCSAQCFTGTRNPSGAGTDHAWGDIMGSKEDVAVVMLFLSLTRRRLQRLGTARVQTTAMLQLPRHFM